MSTTVSSATANAPTSAPRPTPRPAARDNTAVATRPEARPADSSDLSVNAEKPNPFSDMTPNSAEVKVDKWKEGKNDSIESILRNQGYSLNDIYSKDENGKTLVDRVAAANDLKNPNIIQPGQSLTVPSKEDSAAMSTKDLEAGQDQSARVSTGDTAIEATHEKREDGTNVATVKTENADSDARISSETTVGDKGRIDTTIARDGDKVEAQSVAMSGDGRTASQVDTVATDDSSSVKVTDIDSNRNLEVSAGENGGVTVTNPGADADNTVTTNIDTSEDSQDGMFETGGRRVAEFFGYGGEQAEVNNVSGASSVNATRDDEGATRVTANVNGEEQLVTETAGDHDDTWIERAGEGVDNFFSWAGGLFGGGEEAETGAVYEQTRRGRRRAR